MTKTTFYVETHDSLGTMTDEAEFQDATEAIAKAKELSNELALKMTGEFVAISVKFSDVDNGWDYYAYLFWEGLSTQLVPKSFFDCKDGQVTLCGGITI